MRLAAGLISCIFAKPAGWFRRTLWPRKTWRVRLTHLIPLASQPMVSTIGRTLSSWKMAKSLCKEVHFQSSISTTGNTTAATRFRTKPSCRGRASAITWWCPSASRQVTSPLRLFVWNPSGWSSVNQQVLPPPWRPMLIFQCRTFLTIRCGRSLTHWNRNSSEFRSRFTISESLIGPSVGGHRKNGIVKRKAGSGCFLISIQTLTARSQSKSTAASRNSRQNMRTGKRHFGEKRNRLQPGVWIATLRTLS